MSRGGGGGSAPQATYTSIDGQTFKDPNKAADRDRMIQLASAFGYDRTAPGATYDFWLQNLAPDQKASYNDYNNQGLTASDYRAEKRLKDQEAQAQQAEDQRKASVAQSRGAIDNMFSGFDDSYYNGIGKTVMDYYLPQLQDQHAQADKSLTYQLARQGLLDSTAGIDRKAKLQTDYDTQLGGLANKAADAERGARENVSASKSQLYNYADVAADPAAVNDRLASETSRIRANAPELTPMGQVFSDYLTPIAQMVGAGVSAERQGYRGFNTGLFNSGSSSQNVVRTA